MRNYKVKLTDDQRAILNNNINYDECRRKSFSVLSYIVKHTTKNNGTWSKSLEDIHGMYIRHHDFTCLANFKKIIRKLADFNLINIEKVKNRNVYSVAKIVAKKVAEIEDAESVDIDAFKEDLDDTEILNPKSPLSDDRGIDLDSNCYATNNQEIPVEFDLEEYIQGESKVTDFEIVMKKAKELFKALNVRSQWIKERVMSKLSKYYMNITIKHMERYICKAIADARNTYNSNWEASRRADNSNLRFNNFDGRAYSREDYKNMEWKLLGWDE